jgi:hypothetical protein
MPQFKTTMRPIAYWRLRPRQIYAIWIAQYKAKLEGSSISPCAVVKGVRMDHFEEHSFTLEKGKEYFWYNTEDQSTHVIDVGELINGPIGLRQVIGV